jgi:hypothetical protein
LKILRSVITSIKIIRSLNVGRIMITRLNAKVLGF